MGDARYQRFYERDEARRATMAPAQAVLGAFLGLMMPVSYSGKLYLVRELQRFGVDTSAFPEQCLRRLTETVVAQCKFMSKIRRRPWRAELTSSFEGTALLIAYHLSGDRKDFSLPDTYADILSDYGIAFGSAPGGPISNDWTGL
ncbi:MAG TPA: hypothetical protein VG166_09880 [Caulobacteraceae bacterium]|nr:hypothetical protein [Caulobacteraceae bacterium]